ncbi:hypothetical protein GGX14DRAFT_456059 [Mycena pura]|uniref:HNH nuclease domain-containing protein n=1 Tax=Mycena pura TaxID=153505 RepID=A0AAD6VAG2_9AGAR|nr:hypothetical protein GGX14DRAFT_456059 [Mycena pura]
MANPSIALHMQMSESWQRVLVMPLDEMKKLSTRPLRWLRYMGYCIYGAEGHLQATILGHNAVDPNQTTGLANDYYYFSSHPARFIDIEAIGDKITDSAMTPRRKSFRREVVNRDSVCIVTRGEPRSCEACHIIPHSKGNGYLESLSVYRGIDPAITEIKDPVCNNGLLLFVALHKPFRLGEIGLLLVTSHHDPNASDRLILQHIMPADPLFNSFAQHNTDAAFNNGATRPEPQLLHFFYGCAILKRWGVDAQSLVPSPLRDREIFSREEGPRGRSNAWQSGATRSMEDVMDFVLSIATRDPLLTITTRDPPEDKTNIAQNKVTQWLKDVT